MVKSFLHIGISVMDLEASIKFYSEIMQMDIERSNKYQGDLISRIVGVKDANLDICVLEKNNLRIELLDYNNDKRKKLEAITHPRIRDEIIRDLASSASAYTLLVSPLLIESGQAKLVKKVIVVDVPESIQISRTCSRDENNDEQVKRIIAAQLPRQQRLSHADWVIDNNEPLAILDARIAALHKELLTLIDNS